MRIYAVADIHGRSSRLAFIRRHILELKPDVLVVAGDITGYVHPRQVIARLNAMPAPVLVVRGNSDLSRVEALVAKCGNVSSLHLSEITVAGIGFTGLGGTIPVPFRSRICFREKRLMDSASPLVKDTSVLVTHTPPWGVLDRVAGRLHSGSRGLRRLIVDKQPSVALCGHIHEDSGAAFIGRTHVINCSIGSSGHGVWVDIEKGHAPSVTFI